MKKLFLLAALAFAPFAAEAAWGTVEKPTRMQEAYKKAKKVATHKATLCALAAACGALAMREYMKWKHSFLFQFAQQNQPGVARSNQPESRPGSPSPESGQQ